MKLKYGYRYHRELLKESLETSKYISKIDWKERQKKFNYEYYGFDERVNQLMFIIKNIEKNYKQPTWLFIEIIEDVNK